MKNWLTVYTLCVRELVRFYRQPSRVMGAFISPLFFWVMLGSGIGKSFQSGMLPKHEFDYLAYFFPGTLLMILLFTAIFSTISIIEDRREGFLQAVLVAPVSRHSIVMGKILGGAILAFTQAVLFLMIVPLAGFHLHFVQLLQICGILLMSAVTLTGLGFIMAWRINSVQGYHALMNIFLMPLWIMSGALFPLEGAMPWVQTLMRINPLMYQLTLLQRVFFGSELVARHVPDAGFSILVTLVFGTFVVLIAGMAAGVRDHKNLV